MKKNYKIITAGIAAIAIAVSSIGVNQLMTMAQEKGKNEKQIVNVKAEKINGFQTMSAEETDKEYNIVDSKNSLEESRQDIGKKRAVQISLEQFRKIYNRDFSDARFEVGIMEVDKTYGALDRVYKGLVRSYDIYFEDPQDNTISFNGEINAVTGEVLSITKYVTLYENILKDKDGNVINESRDEDGNAITTKKEKEAIRFIETKPIDENRVKEYNYSKDEEGYTWDQDILTDEENEKLLNEYAAQLSDKGYSKTKVNEMVKKRAAKMATEKLANGEFGQLATEYIDKYQLQNGEEVKEIIEVLQGQINDVVTYTVTFSTKSGGEISLGIGEKNKELLSVSYIKNIAK